jgi:hypothetical protein
MMRAFWIFALSGGVVSLRVTRSFSSASRSFSKPSASSAIRSCSGIGHCLSSAWLRFCWACQSPK